MKNLFISKKIILVLIPILSLYFGFLFDEDLSTGGSEKDFHRTFAAVEDFSDFIYNTTYQYTRHFPFHYLFLSIPHIFFNDTYATRVVYLLFSLTFPFFVYLNLCKFYESHKINNLILSSSLLFLPFFRASAIWPNAHLTALIFLLIANYFYIINIKSNNFYYKFLNIFFLSLSTYCIQSYAVFFLFYLFNYYKNNSKKKFLSIMILCITFSLPGFYLILTTPTGTKLDFSNDFSYTVITNLSIIFFFLLFFLINKLNFLMIRGYLSELKLQEIFLLISLFGLLIFNLEGDSLSVSAGGGFFYKLSFFIFKNNILFYSSSFLGLLICYLLYKNEKKIFYIILLLNFTSIAYYTSQKYFEPLLIISIFIFYKNFLTKNIINSYKGSLTFFMLIFIYFIIATINNNYGLSKNLILNF